MIKCMAHLPRDVRSSLRFFAFFVANGTLAVDLLGDIDYRSELVDTGSNLEMVFAVFANVLEVDESGQVTNHDGAAYRAAQWIRAHCDDAYEVEPPFEDWEVELAL